MNALLAVILCLQLCLYGEFIYAEIDSKSQLILPPQMPACESFIQSKLISHNKKSYVSSKTYEYTFSSPNYPQHYPNATDCIKIIQAPSSKHRIVIDFRERFEMEPSNNCQFDYLEIREGPYGYSPLLGKYCNKFPEKSELRTKGEFAWIRFHSDRTIDKQGFTAVYYFEPKPETIEEENKLCRLVVNFGKEVILRQTHLPLLQNESTTSLVSGQSAPVTDFDCSFDISVPSPLTVFLSFFHLYFHHENNCNIAFMEFYDGFSIERMKFTVDEVEVFRLCGPDILLPPRITTKTGRLIVRVVMTSASKRMPRYKMVVTQFDQAKVCSDNQFKCGLTSYCIPLSLTCNGHINCPNAEDEICQDKKVIHHGISTEKKLIKTTPQNLEAAKKGNYHPYILGFIGGALIIICSLWFTISLRHRNQEKKKLKDLDIEIKADGDVRISNHKKPSLREPDVITPTPKPPYDNWTNRNHVNNVGKKLPPHIAHQEPDMSIPPAANPQSRPDSSVGSVYYIPRQHDPSVCSIGRNWSSQKHALKHQSSDASDLPINGLQSPNRYIPQSDAIPGKGLVTSDTRGHVNSKKATSKTVGEYDPMKRIGKYLANSTTPPQDHPAIHNHSHSLQFTQPAKRNHSSRRNIADHQPQSRAVLGHSHSGYIRINDGGHPQQYFDYNETDEIKPMYRARSWAGGLKQAATPDKYLDECSVYYDENMEFEPAPSYSARTALSGLPPHVCSHNEAIFDLGSNFENMIYEYEA